MARNDLTDEDVRDLQIGLDVNCPRCALQRVRRLEAAGFDVVRVDELAELRGRAAAERAFHLTHLSSVYDCSGAS
jgi:hypothetical protein